MHPRMFWLESILVIVLGLGSCVLGCRKPVAEIASVAHDPCWFVDITNEVGLHFVHEAGPTDRYFMPQVIGSGGVLFDFDNDGRLDIYLVQNGGPSSRARNRLFRQGTDGHFIDVSAGSGLDIAGYGMGVAVGDINNDGWPDVLVTQYGGLRLFLNNGDGTFTDISKDAGLDSVLWATSAAFVDYDRDGWLDLVVVNYVNYDPSLPCGTPAGQADFCHPRMFEGTVTKLYRNLGVGAEARRAEPASQESAVRNLRRALPVRFEDSTLKAGLARARGPGLGVICADFNGDHWPDIFVANDGKPNHLWINQQDGTFKEEAVLRGVAYNAMGKAEGNMGTALGDVDGDGLFDLFVTHLTDETNTLWKQGPRGVFQDRTGISNLTRPCWRGTGFGTVLADFDHDGALDLAVVNGAVRRKELPPGTSVDSFWTPYAERNQLFVNDGRGSFRDISEGNAPFSGAVAVSRGLVCGDVDNDGALDLLVTAIAGPARLFRNVAPKRGHWLTVRVVDPARKRDAYGAEISVQAGARRWMRCINPAYSYLCSNDPRAHFGLGAAERVDRIDVVWPDGTEETFPGQAADQAVLLRKGGGKTPGK
jgi:hypothetical protein